MVGHVPEFLRDPVALLERGHRERGNLYTLRIGKQLAVVLLGPERSRFFFSETDHMRLFRRRTLSSRACSMPIFTSLAARRSTYASVILSCLASAVAS